MTNRYFLSTVPDTSVLEGQRNDLPRQNMFTPRLLCSLETPRSCVRPSRGCLGPGSPLFLVLEEAPGASGCQPWTLFLQRSRLGEHPHGALGRAGGRGLQGWAASEAPSPLQLAGWSVPCSGAFRTPSPLPAAFDSVFSG